MNNKKHSHISEIAPVYNSLHIKGSFNTSMTSYMHISAVLAKWIFTDEWSGWTEKLHCMIAW